MLPRRRNLLIGVVAASLLILSALGFGLRQALIDNTKEVSPWLYCTTNPCQPLALFPLPTPPALTYDESLAAACAYSGPGVGDGILLWHTDWDPRTEKGRCASSEEAAALGAN